jgi:hypothetical protein
MLTDSEDDDDDPFGIDKPTKIMDTPSSKPVDE